MNTKNFSKKNGGGKVIPSSNKLIKSLKMNQRVTDLEKWQKAVIETQEMKMKFDSNLLFGLNGLVESLVDKGLITLEEMERGRQKVIKEYIEDRQKELDAINANKNATPTPSEAQPLGGGTVVGMEAGPDDKASSVVQEKSEEV